MQLHNETLGHISINICPKAKKKICDHPFIGGNSEVHPKTLNGHISALMRLRTKSTLICNLDRPF